MLKLFATYQKCSVPGKQVWCLDQYLEKNGRKIFSDLIQVLRSFQGLLTCVCFVRIQSIDSEVHGTENSAIAHQTWPSLEDKTHLLWRSVVLPVQYLRRWETREIYIPIDLTVPQEGDSQSSGVFSVVLILRWHFCFYGTLLPPYT